MKRTFFERIAGTISLKGNSSDYEEDISVEEEAQPQVFSSWEPEGPTEVEGELTVDVYQTNDSIVVQAMVAGVPSEDLSVTVTREMITIKGKREAPKGITPENYFYQELYWGSFSRTILLPAEVDTDGVEATERRGLLTVKIPKLDKGRVQTVKIKSI